MYKRVSRVKMRGWYRGSLWSRAEFEDRSMCLNRNIFVVTYFRCVTEIFLSILIFPTTMVSCGRLLNFPWRQHSLLLQSKYAFLELEMSKISPKNTRLPKMWTSRSWKWSWWTDLLAESYRFRLKDRENYGPKIKPKRELQMDTIKGREIKICLKKYKGSDFLISRVFISLAFNKIKNNLPLEI